MRQQQVNIKSSLASHTVVERDREEEEEEIRSITTATVDGSTAMHRD